MLQDRFGSAFGACNQHNFKLLGLDQVLDRSDLHQPEDVVPKLLGNASRKGSDGRINSKIVNLLCIPLNHEVIWKSQRPVAHRRAEF